jgi:quercetin dioxygenase-like cupin family protein
MPTSHTASGNHEDPHSHVLPFVHAAAGSGEALDVLGDLLVLRTQPTREAPMLAVEATVAPGGGPPAHTHAAEELFLVQEGRLAFLTGEPGVERLAGPGDLIHVPGGRPHGYRNVGQAPARMLVVFDDGLQIVPLWRAVGQPVDPATWTPLPPPPVETILAAANEHGVELVGRASQEDQR